MLEKCFPSLPPPIHLWGRIGKAGVRGWWVDLCISAAAWSPPTQSLWAGAQLSLSAFLPFSFSVLPRIPHPPHPTFPQSCSTWWLCMAAFVSVNRLSELFSPFLSPPSFSTHWHVSLVERVKECNLYWNGLWWRQSYQEAGLPSCCSPRFLSLCLPVKKW